MQVIEIPDVSPRGQRIASAVPDGALGAVEFHPVPLIEAAEVLAVSPLDIGGAGVGAQPFSTRVVTADTVGNPGELLEVDASAGEVIITPPPAPAPGTYLTVLKIDSTPNVVHWAAPVNSDIEGAQIVAGQAAATFVYDGTEWIIESVNTSFNLGVADAVTPEGAQDAVAAALAAGTHTGIGFNYNDVAGALSAAVTYGATAGTAAAGNDPRLSRVFVQSAAPTGTSGPYLWVQTGLAGGNTTLWIEDGS